MLRNRLIAEWSVIALLATLFVAAMAYTGITRRFDNLVYDVTSLWHAKPASDRILIVEIDNQSLKTIGKWPWSRDIHAKMLNQLANAAPAAVAYDVLFVEASVGGDDQALANAMLQSAPVLLPVLFQVPGLNGTPYDLFRPVEPILSATKGLGTVNLLFDEDGIVRRAQLETKIDSGSLPHLMEQTYRAVEGHPSPTWKKLLQNTSNSGEDSALIPLLPRGSFRHISFSSIVSGEVPGEFLENKIILVGATGEGMNDSYPVPGPAGSSMSGVEIQANMLNGLLTDSFIKQAPTWLVVLLSVLPIWLLMLLFLRLAPNRNLIVSLLLIFAVAALAMAAVILAGFWVPPGSALLGLLIIYPLWGWRRLEALSGFVGAQALALRRSLPEVATGQIQQGGLDSVANQAAELSAMIGTVRNIQSFMSDVVSGFPDAVCVVDRDRRVTLANEAAQQLLGSDIRGELFAELLTTVTHSRMGDEIRHSSGKTLLIREAPLTREESEDGGAIIRLADISRLKEADQERDEVLAFLSHDMRAPQSAIISLLEMSEEKIKESVLWRRISDYARRTLKLADDFVQHAKLSSTPLAHDDVDLGGVLSEAIDACWPQANRKQVKLETSRFDQVAFVEGDHTALMRTFINLIDNAIKYSPSESIVTVSMETAKDEVHCRIQDQGPGLPPERRDDIFARFGSRGSTQEAGAGLGLAYVKSVVELHGGSIFYEEAPSGGACFRLSFKLAPEI